VPVSYPSPTPPTIFARRFVPSVSGAAAGPPRAAQPPFKLRCGRDAIARTTERELIDLTEAATRPTFYTADLTAEQRAANERVVQISGRTCVDASLSGDRHFTGVFFGGRLGGFAIATRHRPDDLEIDWLMMHPSHHGSGMAAALLRHALEWLGPGRPIWLNVIRRNGRAIAFYRKFGFEIDPLASTDHAVPHWIMRRPSAAL
jgi:GNAT superfamily N-acetyltransferase